MMEDPLRNTKDPLNKAGPEKEKELFRKICMLIDGFPEDVVMNVASNIHVNVVRQQHATQRRALDALEKQHARAKELLAAHYYAAGGRRNVFPFTLNIDVPLMRRPGRK